MDKNQLAQHNEHMILLEFFVERVVYNDKVDPNLQAGKTSVDFQFLDNEPITIEAYKSKENQSLCKSAAFNNGKTCLFSLTPEQAAEAAQLFDLFVRVYQSRKCGTPQNVLVGIALIPLTNIFKEIIKKSGDKSTESPPGASKFLRNSVPLTDLENYPTIVGHICTSVRLTCYGKFIQTDFRMDMDHTSIDYKANEAKYRLKYHKKFEACPEVCGPELTIPCATPHTCGLSNPAIDPTPMPSALVIQSKSKASGSSKGSKKGGGGGKGKGKGKGGKNKGKGGKGKKGKKSATSITPGSCKSNVSCPDSCPSVYKALQEKKCKEEQDRLKATAIPSPCPPSCYDKEKQTHIQWNDCPPNCPSAPSQDEGDCPSCCPVNIDLNPKACPNPCEQDNGPKPCPPKGPCGPGGQEQPCCAFMTTQPGEPLGSQSTCPRPECSPPPCEIPPAKTDCQPQMGQTQGAQQYAPAFYLGGSAQQPRTTQNQKEPCDCNQHPVTMMYASEANYNPNPPTDMFQMDMGLGGSLCCRVHQETPTAQMSCPVNYMAPPTLNGVCPFSCSGGGPSNGNGGSLGFSAHKFEPPCPQTCRNCGPPCQSLKQPQIVEMRPGMDEDTPFRFTVGNGAIDQNQLCVSPPTYIADDGTKYTELSDPKKQVFVMRIGKKYEGTMGGRNNIDLHLTTPPPPFAEPEVTCTYQQYNIADTPPGSKYFIGDSAPAKAGKADGGKKGGKKGKGGGGGKKGGKKGKGGGKGKAGG